MPPSTPPRALRRQVDVGSRQMPGLEVAPGPSQPPTYSCSTGRVGRCGSCPRARRRSLRTRRRRPRATPASPRSLSIVPAGLVPRRGLYELSLSAAPYAGTASHRSDVPLLDGRGEAAVAVEELSIDPPALGGAEEPDKVGCVLGGAVAREGRLRSSVGAVVVVHPSGVDGARIDRVTGDPELRQLVSRRCRDAVGRGLRCSIGNVADNVVAGERHHSPRTRRPAEALAERLD